VLFAVLLGKHIHPADRNRPLMSGIAVEVVVEVVGDYDVQQRTVLTYTVQLFHQGNKTFPNVLKDVVSADLVNRVVLKGQLVILNVTEEVWFYQRVIVNV
jgi:hypothetical protein